VTKVRKLSEYATKVVRLFPDYAESPMWFSMGPVSFEHAHLSDQLETELRAWEASYYADGDPFKGWSSPEAAMAFSQEGLRLARILAEEIGENFEVEVDADAVGRKKVRFRGHSSLANPEAALAFRLMAEGTQAHFDEIQRRIALGETFGWTASQSGSLRFRTIASGCMQSRHVHLIAERRFRSIPDRDSAVM
jgi:hypothetical protein